MESQTKLQEEHINMLKSLQRKKQELAEEAKQIGLMKLELETREVNLKEFYADLINFEKKAVNIVQQEYGQGVVDLETGTFVAQ